MVLDLGIYVVAESEPFEVRASRASYSDPVVARLVREAGDITLPEGLPRTLSGLSRFIRVQVADSTGRLVVDRHQRFCANLEAIRVSPATITRKYRNALGLSRADGSVSVDIRVLDGQRCRQSETCAPAASDGTAQPAADEEPRAVEPPANPNVPASGPLPDLRAVPAFDIDVDRGQWLVFSANEWNAGPSRLVVDGFRREGEDVMDAYRYFYDENGEVVGSAPVGTMKWDDRDGHTHWHFTDFARYRLLDADKDSVVRSRKEAFCLAPTDAIDLTMAGASWQPTSTGLHSACGNYTAPAVREVLDAGWGDTYLQTKPGESFDLQGLPNGKYFIEVTVNPRSKLYESDTDNNVAYRKIWIGGKPGDRTVRVPEVGLVGSP